MSCVWLAFLPNSDDVAAFPFHFLCFCLVLSLLVSRHWLLKGVHKHNIDGTSLEGTALEAVGVRLHCILRGVAHMEWLLCLCTVAIEVEMTEKMEPNPPLSFEPPGQRRKNWFFSGHFAFFFLQWTFIQVLNGVNEGAPPRFNYERLRIKSCLTARRASTLLIFIHHTWNWDLTEALRLNKLFLLQGYYTM